MKCELTYQETLNIIEKFMINSDIRQYCTDICKGQCCLGCYKDNPNACHRQEGRRLACSIYTCYGLKNQFSKEVIKILSKIDYDIRDKYYEYDCRFDVYFDVPNKIFFRTVRFPISIKEDLGRINIRKIKNIMNKLIKTKEKVY